VKERAACVGEIKYEELSIIQFLLRNEVALLTAVLGKIESSKYLAFIASKRHLCQIIWFNTPAHRSKLVL